MISSGGGGGGDKFFSRVLSKENSPGNPSFRVYYGVAAGSVPFFWESQPGTPKHTMAATALPPLTPPPSYYTSSRSTAKSPSKSPKHSLIQAILPRLTLTKRHRQFPPSLPPPSPLESSLASPRSHRRGRSSGTISSFSSISRADDEEHDAGLSPTSTLCFGERGAAMAGVKKALLSIVGHGSGQRAAAA